MINKKDDYAIFLILSCHQCPLCVCANRSVAKGQIRASPGRENAPRNLSFDTPTLHTPQCVSAYASSGICFSAIQVSFRVHKCTDKNRSPFFQSPLCMVGLGSREAQMRPLHSALADCELVHHCLPTLEWSSVIFLCFFVFSQVFFLLSKGRMKNDAVYWRLNYSIYCMIFN